VSEIAAAADCFPGQVTYYFRTKEALFVEAACRDLLHAASAVEDAGRRARTPEGWARATVRTALQSPALFTFVEAMLLARRRPELAPQVQRTLERLHAEGERALSETLARHGWQLRAAAWVEARGFWATVIGIAAQRAASGDDFDQASAEVAVLLMLNLYREV
jgi:AcrR family transcriptional regulator